MCKLRPAIASREADLQHKPPLHLAVASILYYELCDDASLNVLFVCITRGSSVSRGSSVLLNASSRRYSPPPDELYDITSLLMNSTT